MFLPALMAAGVALTLINTKAVFEALIGYQTAFARTAKYGAQKTSLANVQYRRRSGWLPYAELVAGTGFLAIVVYAIQSYNYLAIPFLLAAFMIEQFSSLFARMKRHLDTVERAMGVLMVITGIGFLTGAVSGISIWLLETFPALQNFG